jgi:hypothetical protein
MIASKKWTIISGPIYCHNAFVCNVLWRTL